MDPVSFSRRRLLQGAAACGAFAQEPLVQQVVAKLDYLTPFEKILADGRGNPSPHTLNEAERAAAGLTPETWFLEVAADERGNPTAEIGRPLTRAAGTALNWAGLMKLAARNTVRYIHVCTCTNVADPFFVALWEGVPLRDVLWLTEPKANLRRAHYWGYMPAKSERFHSSLAVDRILEDPPGELPVILAYKMNGQAIPGKFGGPVRLIAPGYYANRSMKWLQNIVLTNDFRADDSYAGDNNDIESRVKSMARFVQPPKEAAASEAFALTGYAQVGASGLREVQYAVWPEGQFKSTDDPFFRGAPWRKAEILPPPKVWGAGVTTAPEMPLQLDPSGHPWKWPMRYAIAQWAALVPGLTPGKYTLACRAVDENGIAQPLPRPLPKTGSNAIHRVPLMVRA